MKRKLCKIAALLLVVVMLVGLAACNNGTDTTSSGDETPGQSGSTDGGSTGGGSTGGGSTGDEPAEVLKVGLLISVTGWFAMVDMSHMFSAQALAAIINEQGGWEIDGKKYQVEIVLSDIQSDFGNVQAAARYLLDQGVKYVIESIDFFVVGIQDLWEENGVMHMTTAMSGDNGFGGPEHPHAFVAGDNGFHNFIPQGMKLLKENFPGVRKLIYCENDTGGNLATWEKMNSHVGEFGFEMIPYANSAVYAGETTDFAAIALQIISSGADAVIGTGSPANAVPILSEMRSLGSDMPYMLCTTLSGEALYGWAGADYAYNAATLGYSLDPAVNTDIANQINDRIRRDHGEETLINTHLNAANALYVLLNVMSMAGSTDVDTVMNTWRAQTEVPTVYGTGNLGGERTFGLPRQWVGNPGSFMIISREEGIRYLDRVPVFVP